MQLSELRNLVEAEFVGFDAATSNVEPVHVANGLYRALVGPADTTLLNRFLVYQLKKKKLPPAYQTESLIKSLLERDGLSEEANREDSIKRLRALLMRVAGADGRVFVDGMASYSAGNEAFVSRDTVGQQGGRFVALWLQQYAPTLSDQIIRALTEGNDPITIACLPLINPRPTEDLKPDEWASQQQLPREPHHQELARLDSGLADAATCLALHLQELPNPLARLRLAALFSCFVILRRLGSLEGRYRSVTNGRVRPFLFSFNDQPDDPISRASAASYAATQASITRFYAWAYGEQLRRQYSVGDLFAMDQVPFDPVSAKKPQDTSAAWTVAKTIATRDAPSEDDQYFAFGEAVHDAVETQSDSVATGYFRNLGVRSGLLWPVANVVVAKRFAPRQDMLAVLIRASVEPGEAISLPELLERFWDRFGVIIGGRGTDTAILESHDRMHVSEHALAANRDRFGQRLQSLGFADALADGVLMIASGAERVEA